MSDETGSSPSGSKPEEQGQAEGQSTGVVQVQQSQQPTPQQPTPQQPGAFQRQVPQQPMAQQTPMPQQPGAQQPGAQQPGVQQPGVQNTYGQALVPPNTQYPYGQAPTQPSVQQPYGQVPTQPGVQYPYGQSPVQPGMQNPYGQQPAGKQPWYGKTWVIILFLLLFWPVGVILMWKKTCTWNKSAKIIVSVLVGLIVVFNIMVTVSGPDALDIGDTGTSSVTSSRSAGEGASDSSMGSSMGKSSGQATSSDSSMTTGSSSSTATSGDVSITTQATPAPQAGTFAADLEQAGTFDTVIVKGSGEAVVDLPNPNCLVRAEYAGDSNFVIWGVDTDGEDCSLMANVIGAFDGITTSYITYSSDQVPAQLRVEADSGDAWQLTIMPMSQMQPLENGKTYTDSQVLYFTEPMPNLTVTMHSNSKYDDDFEMYAIGMESGDQLVQMYGSSETQTQTTSWTDAPGFVVVNTSGDWSVSW